MDAMRSGLLGGIETPNGGSPAPDGAAWCADNGCFSTNYVGDDRWFAWLASKAHRAESCVFATAPDVVGDAAATWERSREWLPRIRSLGFPAAFVAQDGIERTAIEWSAFDVLFLGGSTDWKLGTAARAVTAEAKRRGKHVHMGRVNSRRRLLYAQAIGCDSADGTYLAFGPDRNLPKLLGWLKELTGQLDLLTMEETA